MTPGQLLAERYRLDERIGSGGMGDVWRATDTNLQRAVAIKVLHSTLARDATFRRRFTAEARNVAKLRAPGVVRLHDAREDSDPYGNITAYLVMEYVPGPTLADILDKHGRLSVTQTLRVVARVADALHAAHRAGIIHRDVKPGNVILSNDGEVTLVDFGIAHSHGDPGLTSAGTVMGTPSYASPEQLRDETLTGQSDVYSLGALTYECLTGNPPFAGPNPAAIITGHLYHEPPPLPDYVPAPVARLVIRTLDKDPRRRPHDAAELARVCRDLLDAPTVPVPAAVPAVRDTVAMPVQPPRRRSPVLLLVIALVLIVGAAGGILAWAKGHKGGQNPHDGAAASTSPPAPASPTGPSGPTNEPTQVINVQSGQCLDLGAHGYRTLDCAPDLYQEFTFTGENGTYSLEDEGGKCAHLDSGGNAIIVGSCDLTDGWELTWLETVSGWDHWILRDTAASEHCLSSDKNGKARGRKCAEDDTRQQWRTKAA